MIGFWFGIGVILTVGVVDGLTCRIEPLTSSGSNVEVPVQVMTKDPKVAAGKRVAESNCEKKEEMAHVANALESEPKLT